AGGGGRVGPRCRRGGRRPGARGGGGSASGRREGARRGRRGSGRGRVRRPPCSGQRVGLRREGFDDRVVLVDHAHLRGAAGRPEIVEELDVGPVVLGPLVRGVVLVVDRLDGADGFAGAAVHAFVGLDVEHPVAL